MEQQVIFRVCNKCNEHRFIEDFPVRSNSSVTRENTCRFCKAEARKSCVRLEDKRAAKSQINKEMMKIWASANDS